MWSFKPDFADTFIFVSAMQSVQFDKKVIDTLIELFKIKTYVKQQRFVTQSS